MNNVIVSCFLKSATNCLRNGGRTNSFMEFMGAMRHAHSAYYVRVSATHFCRELQSFWTHHLAPEPNLAQHQAW
jgi:hypothetical protein